MSIPQSKQESSNSLENKSPWFSTTELLEYLGISQEELKQKIPMLQEGIHYKAESIDTTEHNLLWRVDLVDELLCLPIPPLEREAMLKAINNHITCHD